MVNFARARLQYATDLIRSGGNLEAISAKLAQDVAKQVGNITTINPKAATDVIEMVETSSSMEDAKGTVAGWWGNAGRGGLGAVCVCVCVCGTARFVCFFF